MGSFREFSNRTHTLLQGYELPVVLQGITSPDTGWGNNGGTIICKTEFIHTCQKVQNSETSMLSFIHFKQYTFSTKQSIYFCIRYQNAALIKVMIIVAQVSNVAPGFLVTFCHIRMFASNMLNSLSEIDFQALGSLVSILSV